MASLQISQCTFSLSDTRLLTLDQVQQPARCEQLAKQFGIDHLLSRRFKYLSTGETLKTLLCQARMKQPDLLILDELFDGLDVASRASLTATLRSLQQPDFTLVLVLNRFDDIPEYIHADRGYWPSVP